MSGESYLPPPIPWLLWLITQKKLDQLKDSDLMQTNSCRKPFFRSPPRNLKTTQCIVGASKGLWSEAPARRGKQRKFES